MDPQNVYILMLKPENITLQLHSKRDFPDMTKVKILRCEKKENRGKLTFIKYQQWINCKILFSIF